MTNVADDILGKIARQQNDLFRRVRQGSLDAVVVSRGLQMLIQNKGGRENILQPGKAEAQLSSWIKLYRDHLGIKVNLTNVEIPAQPAGFTRLILVAKGATLNQVFRACKSKFPTWSYFDNLDKDVTQNDRDPKNGTYAIWVKDVQEVDEELQNVSADDIKAKGIITMTLLECLLYQLKFFMETGEHLDVENITLCAGSRDSDGGVPYVCWSGGRLNVHWCSPDDAYSNVRARAAVL
ncbi:MAG: hypothetical protein A3B23_01865 [Candidatus Colwellbacteria bacterium RIFCSPLOWO2_01_FULL_48_10]|uniref:Uncharacterized protein n=1 Tax=Candidatus Colwellbacteria bacterium RIFCSPLOWO2_01_FULL_48_10 TaxID=1797690 RepID=A0A1G1Z6Y9_9BACT|nr:MAG: hypothetical protein A3B23_01865 [Candidatus Colwellbacteria bacterium RIFCSPLOWO2_01_FULL_48_10]